MSFYQLPNPWNPGYVIPDYVMAEPPERGTFTTQWLPRGTISELVPDFLAKPGKQLLGRSDASLGSLSGCSIAGSSLGHDSLGASAIEYGLIGNGPPSTTTVKLAQYGQQVAASLVATAKQYPTSQRAQIMRTAMNKLDPKLYDRAKANADALVKRGVPAKAALHHGIALGVVQGLGTELLKLGSRRSPQSSSLSGLGRTRGESALGAVVAQRFGAAAIGGQTTSTSTATPTGVTGNPPQGFTWNHDHWEVCGAGCTPHASPYGGATIDLVTGKVTAVPVAWARDKLISVGPFLFQASPQTSCLRFMGKGSTGTSTCDDIKDASMLDIQMSGLILKLLNKDCKFNVGALAGGLVTSLVAMPIGVMGFFGSAPCITSSMASAAPGTKYGALREFLGNPTPVLNAAGQPTGKTATVFPNQINQDYVQLVGVDDSRKNPIIVTKHPITGDDYGVFLALQPNHDNGAAWGSATNPVDLIITWAPMDNGWESNLVGWLFHLAAEIVDFVGEVVEGIAKATCALLTSPGMTQALLAGAVQSKNGAAVGVAVGAAVGAAACGGQQVPANQLPLLPPPINFTPWLLAGGGLLLVLVMMRSQQ